LGVAVVAGAALVDDPPAAVVDVADVPLLLSPQAAATNTMDTTNAIIR